MCINELMRYLCDDKIYNQVKNALCGLDIQELQKIQEAKIGVILDIIESIEYNNAEMILKRLDELYDTIDSLIITKQ